MEIAKIEPGVAIVRQDGPKYAQIVTAGGHTVVSDEPESRGGRDKGMSPIDLMLASLGACTSMTMRMYAERKGWPLTDVAVKLRLRKVDAADCPGCTAKTGKIDRIDREIELSGALDDEQRRRLLAIADHCPVHKIMLGEKVIVSRLAGEVPEDDPVHG